jgi:hypothetical protein
MELSVRFAVAPDLGLPLRGAGVRRANGARSEPAVLPTSVIALFDCPARELMVFLPLMPSCDFCDLLFEHGHAEDLIQRCSPLFHQINGLLAQGAESVGRRRRSQLLDRSVFGNQVSELAIDFQ